MSAATGLGLGVICAPFISAALLGLARAARALHAWWVDLLDQLLDPDGRAYRVVYPLTHPHLVVYAAWLQATTRRTRSIR